MLALSGLVNLRDLCRAGLAGRAAGCVCAGIMSAAREIHHVAYLEAAGCRGRGLRLCRSRGCCAAAAHFSRNTVKIRADKSTDILAVYLHGSGSDFPSVHIALCYGKRAGSIHLRNNADMIAVASIVAHSVVVPIVYNSLS